MGGTPKGVEIHRAKLRIYFRFEGQLCREPLGLPATRANIKHAARLADDIRGKIRHGVFDYSEYFPNSTRAQTGIRVRDYTSLYIRLQSHLEDSTIRGYGQTLRTLLDDRIGDMPIREVKASTLGSIIEEHGFKTAKSRNNALTPVRGVFELAQRDGAIPNSPAALLKSAKTQAPDPDPLTLDEVEAILSWLSKNKPTQTVNYFEFAFFSGLRVSELLALEWNDIDRRSGTARIQRARVLGNKKTTKTAKIRGVELTKRALSALKSQRAYTHLVDEVIFLDPITGRPYVDDKPPRLQWNAALKSLGIRHRTASQTRHTFATLALMAGANPMWVAHQLGHSTMQMTLTRYSKWIDKADQGRELARLDDALSGDYAGNIAGNNRRT